MVGRGFAREFNFGLLFFLLCSRFTRGVNPPPSFTREFNVEQAAISGRGWQSAFEAFIQSLRDAARDPSRWARLARPVLPPEETRSRPILWFHVVLRNNDPGQNIILRIRGDNLYLHGYQRPNSDQWLELRTRDDPQLIDGSQLLGFQGSYSRLENAGHQGLERTNVGRYELRNAVRTLAESTEPDGRRRARALVVIILMICESMRFIEITSNFSAAGNVGFPPTRRMVTLIHSWEDLSNRLLRADACAERNLFPLPHQEGEPSELADICTAQDAARVLGMLKGDRRASQSSLATAEEDDECTIGWPLMEVISVIINNIDGENPGQLYGSIAVTDGLGTQSLYSRASDDYEDIRPGNAASLIAPVRAISALGSIVIDVKLLDRDFLNPDDQVSNKTIYWGDLDTNKVYDMHLHEYAPGNSGSNATVNFIVFENAVEAKIEVRLVKGDDFNTDEVYGQIVARIVEFGIERVLFFRKSSDYVEVEHGDLIPLSRAVVAVPLSSSLRVTANLCDHDTITKDEEIANGVKYFRAKLDGTSQDFIHGNHGMIQVNITWNPSY